MTSGSPDAADLSRFRPLPRFASLVVVVAGVAAFALWVVRGVAADPEFVMLLPQDGAIWIKAPSESTVRARNPEVQLTYFRTDVIVTEANRRANITLLPFRSVQVLLDGRPVFLGETPKDEWKSGQQFNLPDTLAPGRHSLIFLVLNNVGPPAILVSAPELDLFSHPRWECSEDGVNWTYSWPITRILVPPLSTTFETPASEFARVWPFVAMACAIAGLVAWRGGTAGSMLHRAGAHVTPARLRVALQIALLALGINSMVRASLFIGADSPNHYDYVHWYTEHFGVPRVEDGAQFFQAPLFYAVAAVVHGLLSIALSHDAVDHGIRIVPILCGLGLVEVTYRMLREAFPGRNDIQRIGLLIGSFIPLLLVKTHFVGNEPFAAFLSAITALAVLRLSVSPRLPSPLAFAGVGVLWGLAVLSKVTALALGAPFVLVLVHWCYAHRPGFRTAAVRVVPFLVACAMTCGWFFAVNYARYGKPFIGGWSPEMGFDWWQFPGYRTPEQYLSFGRALEFPVFASVFGFWDGIYAGLWFDSELGGIVMRSAEPKWNYPFAESAILWAALPTLAIIAGGLRAILPLSRSASSNPEEARSHFARVYSLWVVGAYGASVLGHTLVLPYYNAVKASYALASLPMLVVLMTWGLAPLARSRWTRVPLYAWIGGWILLVSVGYWILGA